MPRFDGALLRACRSDLRLSRKQLADLADVTVLQVPVEISSEG